MGIYNSYILIYLDYIYVYIYNSFFIYRKNYRYIHIFIIYNLIKLMLNNMGNQNNKEPNISK